MEFLVKSTPEDLEILKTRIEAASEDLQNDAIEIQYLLSQFQNAISGGETMLDDAMSNISYCKQLSMTLRNLSDCLGGLHTAYKAMDKTTANQIRDSFM